MAVTVTSFVAAFPEFANAPESLVQATLDRAAQIRPVSVWGDLTDQGIELTAARSLALAPAGRAVQLVNKDGSTVYDERLNDLMAAVAGGGRVLC